MDEETTGIEIIQTLRHIELGIYAADVMCRYLLKCRWEHQQVTEEGEEDERRGERKEETVGRNRYLNFSSIVGLKIVPLRIKKKMGTLNLFSSSATPYIMAPQSEYDVLLGNYHLVVDSSAIQKEGSRVNSSFYQLLQFLPTSDNYFNVVPLTPSRLALIGLSYCLPVSWKRRKCVQLTWTGSSGGSGSGCNHLCAVDLLALNSIGSEEGEEGELECDDVKSAPTSFDTMADNHNNQNNKTGFAKKLTKREKKELKRKEKDKERKAQGSFQYQSNKNTKHKKY